MTDKSKKGPDKTAPKASHDGKSLQDTNSAAARLEEKEIQWLFATVKEGRSRELEKCIQRGAKINHQDHNGMTVLHYAAAYGARPCIRILVKSGLCNYLLQDKRGRYASELAFEQARDYAVGILLAKKEAKQARMQGIKAWPKDAG